MAISQAPSASSVLPLATSPADAQGRLLNIHGLVHCIYCEYFSPIEVQPVDLMSILVVLYHTCAVVVAALTSAFTCPCRRIARYLVNVTSVIYYNTILLRLPSFPCFRYRLDDFQLQLPLHSVDSRSQGERWFKLVAMLTADWATSDKQCRSILLFVPIQ